MQIDRLCLRIINSVPCRAYRLPEHDLERFLPRRLVLLVHYFSGTAWQSIFGDNTFIVEQWQVKSVSVVVAELAEWIAPDFQV